MSLQHLIYLNILQRVQSLRRQRHLRPPLIRSEIFEMTTGTAKILGHLTFFNVSLTHGFIYAENQQ